MRHAIGASDVGHALAGGLTLKRLAGLVRVQFWTPPHLHAAPLRPLPPFARPAQDELTLELGQPAENRQDQAPVGCCRIRPGVAQ